MPVSALAASILLCIAAADPKDASDYVALHRATLQRIETLDVKLSAVLKKDDGTELPISDCHWRRAGVNERYSEVTHAAFGNGQLQTLQPPSRRQYGYEAESVRVLENWDSEQPPALPFRPGGKNARVFASIKGAILPRDPAGGYRAAPFWLQFAVTMSHSLPELAAVAEVGEAEIGDDGRIRLALSTPEQERIICFLDPEHGYLISQTEFYGKDSGAAQPLTTIRIRKFDSIGDPPIWFPVHALVEQEVSVLDVRATNVRINEPLHASEVTLEFPEGARVDEPARQLIHVWGRGQPAHTFDGFDDFTRWELAAGRGDGSLPDGQAGLVSGAGGLRHWLVLSNAVIIAAIVALLCVRRRLSTRTEGSPG